jgi:hypothetical protein
VAQGRHITYRRIMLRMMAGFSSNTREATRQKKTKQKNLSARYTTSSESIFKKEIIGKTSSDNSRMIEFINRRPVVQIMT